MTKSRTKGKSLSLCWGYGEACVGVCACVCVCDVGEGLYVIVSVLAEGHVLVMYFLDFCRSWLNDPEGRRSERVCLYSHIVTLLFIWRSGRDALLKKPMRWEACRRFHCARWMRGKRGKHFSRNPIDWSLSHSSRPCASEHWNDNRAAVGNKLFSLLFFTRFPLEKKERKKRSLSVRNRSMTALTNHYFIGRRSVLSYPQPMYGASRRGKRYRRRE